MKYFTVEVLLFIILLNCLHAQEQSTSPDLTLNGYLSAMPSLYWQKDTTMWQALLHNRLNLEWDPSSRFSVSVQLRNQLIGGDFVKAQKGNDGFIKDGYFLPLTYHETFNREYLLSLAIDRVWVQYTINKFEIKVGRQRINWGQTFIWNPNDIFNSYNFYDFDYPEKPGTDAIRVQYYANQTSSLDIALRMDSSKNASGAALYRFNKWNCDFQVMAGNLRQSNQMMVMDTVPLIRTWNDNDLVSGFGFSGAIKSISIRGEMSYFYSLKKNCDSTNQVLISLASDYTFKNETSVMFEFFYAQRTYLQAGSDLLSLYTGTQNIKNQAISHYNYFGQITYPVNPIISATLSGMLYYDRNISGIYAGPSVEVSLSDNMSLSLLLQHFSFKMKDSLTQTKDRLKANFAFLRWKINF